MRTLAKDFYGYRYPHTVLNHLPLICGAGFVAGFVNAVAGGGTLVSFPALLAGGLSPITANATNTLALWPASLTSGWAYRQRLRENSRLLMTLAAPSLLGGLLGAILLITTPEQLFRSIVPFLILLACGLLVVQEKVGRWVNRRAALHPRAHAAALWWCQLAIAVYGGYFGAGIGIMMLAAMAIFLPEDLQAANALKTVLATLINAAATALFIYSGKVVFGVGAAMMVAAMAGGYLGAHAAQRLSPRWLRGAVIAYSLGVAGWMLTHR